MIFTAFCPETNETAQTSKDIGYKSGQRVYNVTLSSEEASQLCSQVGCSGDCEIDVDAEVMCSVGAEEAGGRTRIAQYFRRYSETEAELGLPADVQGQLRSETVRAVMASEGYESWWSRHGKDLQAYCKALLADNGECPALVTADGKALTFPCCCGGPSKPCNCRCSGSCHPYRACPPVSSGSWSNPAYHMLIPVYTHSLVGIGTVTKFLSPPFLMGLVVGFLFAVLILHLGRGKRRRRR